MTRQAFRNPHAISFATGQHGAESVAATAGIELWRRGGRAMPFFFVGDPSLCEASRAPQAKKIAPQARKNLDIEPQY